MFSGSQRTRWMADFSAAFSVAMVALPVGIGGGLIAMAPLGRDFVSLAVHAGLVSAVVAAWVTAFFGSARFSSGGPSSGTSVVLATALAGLTQVTDTSGHVMLMMACVVGLAGAMLFLAGWMGWGGLIKYIPRPVMAGFVDGVALVLLLSQLNAALGLPVGEPLWEHWPALRPGAALLAGLCVGLCFLAPQKKLPVPGALLALLAGSLVHWSWVGLFGPEQVGPVLGELPVLLAKPDWLAAFNLEGLSRLHYGQLLSAAFLVALMAAVQSLMTALSVDAMAHTRHDANRELMGFGLGNIAAALTGGVASSANLGRAIAAFRGGARSRRAAALSGLVLLVLLLLAKPWLAKVPLSVMAGILIHSALVMLDTWSIDQFKRWLAGHERGEVSENVVVTGVMVVGMVWLSPAVVVALGVLLSMFLFVKRMSRSFVRRTYDAGTRTSLKVRTQDLQAVLRAQAGRIEVLELDGALFFGTADRLRQRLEEDHAGAEYLILDCRRVREWDATGVLILGQIQHSLREQGRMLLLAHLSEEAETQARLRAYGLHVAIPKAQQFPDIDRALEYAEDRLLASLVQATCGVANAFPPLARIAIFQSLSEAEQLALMPYFEALELSPGALLFQAGDPGDCLYVLRQGEVSLELPIEGRQFARRLAVITPGVMFGEMALLDALPRSANAVVIQLGEALRLSRAAFERMHQEHPGLFARVMQNIAHEMSNRLRQTNRQLAWLEQG